VELVLGMEETLRECITNLISLGIPIHTAVDTREQLFVLNKLDRSDAKDIPSPVSNGTALERFGKHSISIYNKEQEILRFYDEYCNSVTKNMSFIEEKMNTLKLTDEFGRSISNLKGYYGLLLVFYKDQQLISKVKELELKYLREYLSIVITDSARMEKFVSNKCDYINKFMNSFNDSLVYMKESFDVLDLSDGGNRDSWKNFQFKFKRQWKDITDQLDRLMNPKTNIMQNEIINLEDIYKREYQKIEEDIHYFSNRLINLQIAVK